MTQREREREREMRKKENVSQMSGRENGHYEEYDVNIKEEKIEKEPNVAT